MIKLKSVLVILVLEVQSFTKVGRTPGRQLNTNRQILHSCTYFCFSAKVQSHSRFAKMAEGQDEPKKITITVKTPKEKQQVEIDEDADVKKVSTAPPETVLMA